MIDTTWRRTVRAAGALVAAAAASAATAAEAAEGPALFAQLGRSWSSTIDWGMPVKIASIAAIGLVAWLVAHFVVYPAVLRRDSAKVMPVTLYGRCFALWWCVLCGAALGILWDDLVFRRATFWGEYGVRLGVLATGIGFAVLWIVLWRSDPVPPKEETELS